MLPATSARLARTPGVRVHELDGLVVGAGGAGLYAALELKKDLGPEARIGVISKLYPSRSHTGAAQGGVCAALGNTEEDHWEWHWFDTVKGGDYLVDQDAAEVMCHDAVETIINLEHLGLPFNRTPGGADRPAALRRPHPQLRRGTRAPDAASPPTAPATRSCRPCTSSASSTRSRSSTSSRSSTWRSPAGRPHRSAG